MKLHFMVEVEVDDTHGQSWIAYVRQQLHRNRNPYFQIVKTLPIEEYDDNVAQEKERYAYEHGEMEM